MATKKKPRKARKPKQPFLPGEGMAPPSHPDLDILADDYYDAKKARVTKLEAEKAAKAALIEKMNEHGLTVYITPDDLIVTVLGKQAVQCKKKADQESNGEAGEE